MNKDPRRRPDTGQTADCSDAALSDEVPLHGSIDELIQWVERRRGAHPHQPLSQLIGAEQVDVDRLVELVAIDLIRRRRGGQDVLVEDYVRQFPLLGESQSHLLDLIDAEICVRREMGETLATDCFSKRFPDLTDPIGQLMHLSPRPPLPTGDPADAVNPPSGSIQIVDDGVNGQDQSDDFLLSRDLTIAGVRSGVSSRSADPQGDDSIDAPIPIQPPNWMMGARCIATATNSVGRSWLIKGRDTERNDTVAMKIIPQPESLNREFRTRVLDLCEQTSNVTHPAWIAPRIAAVNNGHLAVVRPWIFGTPFSSIQTRLDAGKRFKIIVRIAFALSAAHRVGATHGGVKASNVILDHNSAAVLIDAASGVAGWEYAQSIWDNRLDKTLDARIRHDAQGLLGMIADECVHSTEPSRIAWLNLIASDLTHSDPDACAKIGEQLQGLLDQPAASREPPTPRWWWRRSHRGR